MSPPVTRQEKRTSRVWVRLSAASPKCPGRATIVQGYASAVAGPQLKHSTDPLGTGEPKGDDVCHIGASTFVRLLFPHQGYRGGNSRHG
jgi:hypothetical protein